MSSRSNSDDVTDGIDPIRFRVRHRATGDLVATGCSFANTSRGGGAVLTRPGSTGPVEVYDDADAAIEYVTEDTLGAIEVVYLDEIPGLGTPTVDHGDDMEAAGDDSHECPLCGGDVPEGEGRDFHGVELTICKGCAKRMNETTPQEDYRS